MNIVTTMSVKVEKCTICGHYSLCEVAPFDIWWFEFFYEKLNEFDKNFPRDTSKVKVHDMKLFALKLVSCCEM